MIWRLIKRAVLLVVVVLIVAAVWAVAAVRTDRPVEYADITEQFKYGSIGSEPGGSLLATVGGVLPPYEVFKALPADLQRQAAGRARVRRADCRAGARPAHRRVAAPPARDRSGRVQLRVVPFRNGP